MTALTFRKSLAIGVSIIALGIVLGLAVACGTAATQEPSPSMEPPATPPHPQSSPATRVSQSPRPTPQPAFPQERLSPPQLQELALEQVFKKLSFSRLTNLIQSGDSTFVTEQTGRVMSFPTNPLPRDLTAFLNLRDRVNDSGNEEGLLGLAFDPEFDSNGHFFVYYSAANPRRSVISQFTAASPGTGMAEPKSELVVMEIPQPYQNHNGGQLAFGPDGMLYVSLGDGGSGGDPDGNGQDLSTLLGSILRIDVSDLGPDGGYRYPLDNPLVGAPNARGEIWAYGFRNPWRFSFDRESGDLWVGDVGQNSFEEIDLVVRGGNYGWNILEGAHCFRPIPRCDPSDTRLPVIEYGPDQGCSVIGGYVYRGTKISSLAGAYLYGDFCSGEIHGLRVDGGTVIEHRLLVDSGLMITSFGEDLEGEIYVLSQDGGIYRFTTIVP